MMEGEEGLEGWLEYNTDLFAAPTMERWAGHFQRLLEGMVAEPEQRISRLPLMSEAELQQVVKDWNDTKQEYREQTCVGRQSAQARAGFLRGRPDRRRPASLEEAREEVELFHAYCDAGLWNEADAAFVALDNPKHRFLAPALERDLLLRFFPGGDWRRPPLWPGFGRYRSLAICLEMLGQFEDALAVYREPTPPCAATP